MISNYSFSFVLNPGGYEPADTTKAGESTKLQNIANDIINPLKFIGTIVSVVALMIIGVKYMLGSVEEKAEYKKTMKPYVIGAFMLFGITNLLGILVSVIGGITEHKKNNYITINNNVFFNKFIFYA